MKSSKRVEDPNFSRKRNTKLNSSFYKNRGEAVQMDQLSAFRASNDSKSLLGFIDSTDRDRAYASMNRN